MWLRSTMEEDRPCETMRVSVHVNRLHNLIEDFHLDHNSYLMKNNIVVISKLNT